MTSNVSNLATRAVGDFRRELARAYDGEVPPPYYWQLPIAPPPRRTRPHPGEIGTVFPYGLVPRPLARGRIVSLDELEEMLERRARHEES